MKTKNKIFKAVVNALMVTSVLFLGACATVGPDVTKQDKTLSDQERQRIVEDYKELLRQL